MQQIPPITRNLLLVNIICFLLQLVLERSGSDLVSLFGLHFILAHDFEIFQLVSYMFLHGSLAHLFFNMLSLWMFGGLIERALGPKRFIIYYFVCGIGAGLCQELWQTGEYLMYGEEMLLAGLKGLPDPASPEYNHMMQLFIGSDYYYELMGIMLNQWTTIGASGACYGVLLAFGMLYPNERIILLFPPIPMKAKYFVAGYAAIEVFAAWSSNDNVAHFAHLGGMLFGWLLFHHWQCAAANQRRTANSWAYRDVPPRGPSIRERLKERFGGLGSRRDESVGNARHTASRPGSIHESDRDYNLRKEAEQKRMDEILDKIRRTGYDGLTADEKRELFRISHK